MSRDRRSFLRDTTSCAAWILGLNAINPLGMRRALAQSDDREIVTTEKWGRIEKVADQVWAVISTPFDSGHFNTVANGGIIAGKDRVLVIEAFNQPGGAKWLGEQAKALTGRWPTDVVVTHYHSDHSAGSSGYQREDETTNLWLTDDTQSRMKRQAQSQRGAAPMLEPVKNIPTSPAMNLDLGGREVRITSQTGHTNSDVTIEISEPNVMFCGDLFFNRLIPNYLDAKPNTLKKTVEGLKREKETIYVPGHGSVASPKDLTLYQEFLEMMGDAAKTAHRQGIEAPQAAKQFKLPERFADWFIFSPQVVPRAFAAWYRELDA